MSMKQAWLMFAVVTIPLLTAIYYREQVFGETHSISEEWAKRNPSKSSFDAFLLTLYSSLFTGAGGLIVYVFGEPTPTKIAYVVCLSAGVMLTISFADMLPHSYVAIGPLYTLYGLLGGVLSFIFLRTCIPAPDDVAETMIEPPMKHSRKKKASSASPSRHSLPKKASSSSSSSSRSSSPVPNGRYNLRQRKSLSTPSDSSSSSSSYSSSSSSTKKGASFDASSRHVSPSRSTANSPFPETKIVKPKRRLLVSPSSPSSSSPSSAFSSPSPVDEAVPNWRKSFWVTGLVMTLAFSLHNFPEGVAVYLSNLRGGSDGLGLTLAIAVHNIPEGICIALPVLVFTNSTSKALLYAIISGTFSLFVLRC